MTEAYDPPREEHIQWAVEHNLMPARMHYDHEHHMVCIMLDDGPLPIWKTGGWGQSWANTDGPWREALAIAVTCAIITVEQIMGDRATAALAYFPKRAKVL